MVGWLLNLWEGNSVGLGKSTEYSWVIVENKLPRPPPPPPPIGQVEPYDSSLVFPATNTSYFTDGNGETHVMNIELHFEVELDLVDLSNNNVNWFHNGIPLNTNGIKYNSSIVVSGQAVQMSLSINNITDKDAGVYSAVLYYTDVNRDFWEDICGGFFFRLRNRLRIDDVILGTVTMVVEKYGKSK